MHTFDYHKTYKINYMKRVITKFVFLCIFTCLPFSVWAKVCIQHLMTEYTEMPLGIDVRQPRFSWQLKADRELGVVQKSYLVIVRNDNGDEVWNSGRITDDRSLNIRYAGKQLLPCTRYHYSVTVWTNRGSHEATSWFETGLMTDNENDSAWGNARWIGGNKNAHTFFCQYFPVFRLACKLRLDSKSHSTRAAFIYGANDLRLMDANKYYCSPIKIGD